MKYLMIAVAVLSLVETPCPAAAPAKKVAVVVGVNRYTAVLPDLMYAENDARDLAARLEQCGLGVDLLTTSDDQLLPTKKLIIEKVRAALKRADSKSDTFVFAYAGHGVSIVRQGETDSYLVPTDGRASNPESLISMTDLFQLLKAGSGSNLLVIDACRSDASRSGGTRGLDGSSVRYLPARTAAIFACDDGQLALESDGNGLMFRACLNALEGGAADREGNLRWNLLTDYVSQAVPKAAAALRPGTKQEPVIIANLSGSPILGRVEPKQSGPAPRIVENHDSVSISRPEHKPMTQEWTVKFDRDVPTGWIENSDSTFFLRYNDLRDLRS